MGGRSMRRPFGAAIVAGTSFFFTLPTPGGLGAKKASGAPTRSTLVEVTLAGVRWRVRLAAEMGTSARTGSRVWGTPSLGVVLLLVIAGSAACSTTESGLKARYAREQSCPVDQVSISEAGG